MPATLHTGSEPARAPEATAHRTLVERSTRILLVEDEPLTAEVFARALSRDGHHVEVARDGLQALRHLRDLGMGIVDSIGPARRFFMRHAGGDVGKLPRLMKGEVA